MSMFAAAAAFLVWGIIVFFSGTSTMHDFTQNAFLAFLVGMVGQGIEEAIKKVGYNQEILNSGVSRREQREAERLAEERRQKVFERKYGPNSNREM